MHNCIDRRHCLRYTILANMPKAVSDPDTTLLQPPGPPGLTINKPHQRTFCCHNTLLPFYWRPSPPVRKCRRHARSTTLLSTMPSIYSLPLGEFRPSPPTFPHPRSPTLPPGGDGACVPISPNRTSSRGKREQWAGEKMLSTAKLMGTQFI